MACYFSDFLVYFKYRYMILQEECNILFRISDVGKTFSSQNNSTSTHNVNLESTSGKIQSRTLLWHDKKSENQLGFGRRMTRD